MSITTASEDPVPPALLPPSHTASHVPLPPGTLTQSHWPAVHEVNERATRAKNFRKRPAHQIASWSSCPHPDPVVISNSRRPQHVNLPTTPATPGNSANSTIPNRTTSDSQVSFPQHPSIGDSNTYCHHCCATHPERIVERIVHFGSHFELRHCWQFGQQSSSTQRLLRTDGSNHIQNPPSDCHV